MVNNIGESWSFFCLEGLCVIRQLSRISTVHTSFDDEEVIEGWDQVNQLPLRILRTKVALLRRTKETLLVIENPFLADECGVPPGLVCKGHGIEIVP